MSDANHTDEDRADLSDDERFSELLQRREELSEIIAAGHEAYQERVELDAEIINMMGNSKSATASGDRIVTMVTQSRKEYTVEAKVITMLKISKDKFMKWRRNP